MQFFVTWWRNAIGVTDPLSIKMAVGVLGAFTLVFSIFFILYLIFAFLAWSTEKA